MSCYRFEERIFNDGIFPIIDATYIIHLEGNNRLSQINHELDIIHPTNRVWILHNKGYRKCKKTGLIQLPAEDLIDSYLHIFKHAKENNLSNILILEDDFFWNLDIQKREHIDSISKFINSNSNTDYMYLLGCLPFLQVPCDITGEHRIVASIGTHAAIYSKKCRERVLKVDQKYIVDWDVYHNYASWRYMYYRPLCYQLFPITENQNNWLSNIIPNFLQVILVLYIFIPILRCLSLHESVEPGYSIFYQFSVYMSILLLLLILWSIYTFAKKYYRIRRTV